MPQSLSKTGICNLALFHLGANQINDISDAVPEAQACNMYWTPCIDDIFNEHEWGFAQAQIPLTLLADTSLAGWCFVYAYPNNVGGVWSVYNPCRYEKKEEIEFDKYYIPGTGVLALASNECEAICDATYMVQDPTLWDPKFAMAFSRRLAAELAKSLTGDDNISQGQMMIYTGMLAESKRIGYNEKKKKPHRVKGYQDARSGYANHRGNSSIDEAFGF